MQRRKMVCISMLVALMVAATLFAGCSAQQAQQMIQNAQNKVIETALVATVDSMVDSALAEYEQAAPAVECLQARVTLTVIDSELGGDGMVATCRVSSPDVSDFIKSVDPNDYANEDGTVNEQKLIDDVIAAIKAAPIKTQTVTIEVESTENGYVPADTEEFVNAYTGGALELLMEMYGEYIPQ